MNIKKFVFNPFMENTYVIWADSSECAIIDPGMMSDKEKTDLTNFLKEKNLTPVHLLNTHMHIDHVAGNEYICNTYNLVSEGNIADNMLAERVKSQAEMFGVAYDGNDLTIGKHLKDGDTIALGSESIRVLEIPGHSKGHLAFYSEASGAVFSGDALFHMSIGRTDLPSGDYNELLTSIDTKLMVLPESTIVYPGHGPKTTIGFEYKHNPYIV